MITLTADRLSAIDLGVSSSATSPAHHARMRHDPPNLDARGRPIITFGPAGCCDACARACITLDQVGIRCFFPGAPSTM
jgi:hypothetical protein